MLASASQPKGAGQVSLQRSLPACEPPVALQHCLECMGLAFLPAWIQEKLIPASPAGSCRAGAQAAWKTQLECSAIGSWCCPIPAV